MDTHAQSAMHKQEASIAGLLIMMRVVIGEMVFVPGLASTALHAQTQPWTFPAGRAKCTYSAKQTPRPSGASSPATHAAPGLSAKRKTPPVLLDEFAEPVEVYAAGEADLLIRGVRPIDGIKAHKILQKPVPLR